MRYWTWITHFFVWGTILSYFIIVIIYSALRDFNPQVCALAITSGVPLPVAICRGSQFYFLFYEVAAMPSFWLGTVLIIVAALLFDVS